MSDKLRETRAQLQGEMQQIAEHTGEITKDMADRFDSLEAQVRELDASIRREDMQSRFADMQAEPVAPRMAPGAKVETADSADDWAPYLRYWQSAGMDTRVLNTVEDAAVVPDVLQAEMARKFAAVSGAIQAVRRSQLPTKASVAKVSTRVSVTAITAEAGDFDNTEPAFATVDFTTDQMAAATTELTVQAIQDSTPDLISEVSLEHAEELGRFWSDSICNGITVSSALQTDGIFDSASIVPAGNQLTATAADAITAAELIELRYDKMPAEYWSGYGDLGWIMGQDTFAHIAGLTDSANGRPLMQPFADSTISSGIGMTLLGLPIYLDAGAPALATGNTTVALVARNAYRFIERTPGLTTAINNYAQQSKGVVEVNTFQRGVGRFVRPEACAILTQA